MPHLPITSNPSRKLGCVRYLSLFRTLELPSIGWQLFVLGSSQSDSTAFSSLLDTYATRLLTEPLSRQYHIVFYRQDGCLHAVCDPELSDDVMDVVLYGTHADAEISSDLLVALPPYQVLEDLHLPG